MKIMSITSMKLLVKECFNINVWTLYNERIYFELMPQRHIFWYRPISIKSIAGVGNFTNRAEICEKWAEILPMKLILQIFKEKFSVFRMTKITTIH